MKYNFYLFVLFVITILINHTNQEEINVKEVLNQIKEMFYFGYDNYMKYAFPRDELKPISCSGVDSFGSLTITLIDTLDTLAIFSNKSEFTKQVEWICSEIKSFDKDVNISVFETNIRVLGGLLSSHMLAMDKNLGLMEVDYSGCLLNLAEDLAKRLMPAFEKSKTGIPYGTVNLRHGVPPEETKITSVAGAGSYSMEFGVLSRLTGDNSYEAAALKAVQHIFDKKSRLGLLGNHIDIDSGNWTHRDAGIGANVDSYYEYLLKSAILFGDRKYFDLFVPLYESAITHLKKGEWYVEIEMESGIMTWPIFSTLQGFWPGLQVLYGDILQASKTMKSFMNIFKKNGFSPEGYNLASDNVQPGREGYPLRPELAESLYYLYQATKDSTWRNYGLDILHSIALMTRTKCGFARVENVQKMTLSDLMDSFFLSETLKYLFLLFDEDNFVNKQPSYIFTTEAHIFDISYFSEFPPLSNLSLHSVSSNCRFSNYQNLLSSNGFNFEYNLPKKPVNVPQPSATNIVNNIPANLKFDNKMNSDEAKEAINKLLSNLNINGKDVKIKFNPGDVTAQFQNIEVSDNSFVDADSVSGNIVNEDSQFIVSNTDEYIQIDAQDLDIKDLEKLIGSANIQQIKMERSQQFENDKNKNHDDSIVLPKMSETDNQNQNTNINEQKEVSPKNEVPPPIEVSHHLDDEANEDTLYEDEAIESGPSHEEEESDYVHLNEEDHLHNQNVVPVQEENHEANEDSQPVPLGENNEEDNNIVFVLDDDSQGDLRQNNNDMHLHTQSATDQDNSSSQKE